MRGALESSVRRLPGGCRLLHTARCISTKIAAFRSFVSGCRRRIFREWRQSSNAIAASSTNALKQSSWSAASVTQCIIGNSRFHVQIVGDPAANTAGPATRCRSNPVSERRLPKTGIFQMSARDYRLFRSGYAQNGSLETDCSFAKARHWPAFQRVSGAISLSAGLLGWGGRDRTSEWWNQNPLLVGAHVRWLQSRASIKRAIILLGMDWHSSAN
jgi:hypothetical protein